MCMSRAANLSLSKQVLSELKKPYFEVKKSIFALGARITKFFRPGSRARFKGPGSKRVLGALWCNLSLIFEHYDSKTYDHGFIT